MGTAMFAVVLSRSAVVFGGAVQSWPYLLRDRKIVRSNQVFALDTKYVPMAQGFVYLTAVIDWASRRVLAHRVATTMEAEHAVAALEEAFAKYGLPEIVNTDQGSSPVRYSPTPSSHTESLCRWMAKEAGGTTFLSNGCGAA